MSGFTPGPWKGFGRKTDGLAHSMVGNTTLLARVYSKTYQDVAEEEANARLIAAAPDLLAACKQASEILRGRGDPGWGIAKDILNTAIAKATALSSAAPMEGER